MNHAELLNYLDFDPESGVFTRKVAAGNKKAGSVVGNIDAKGYLKALVLGEYVKLHRLAWFYVYSEWPSDQIDHINNVKTDNRIQNLRVCDTSTNCHNQHGPRINNNSGFQGIHKIAKTGRYRAACSVNGVKQQLGIFATAEEAAKAYQEFKSQHLPKSP